MIERALEVEKIELDPIFPFFFKFYDDDPMDRATLYNLGELPIADIKVSLLIEQYMDNPKQYTLEEALEPGERRDVPLYALLTSKILEESEGTKVTSNITVEYSLSGESRTAELIETVRINNHNAMGLHVRCVCTA